MKNLICCLIIITAGIVLLNATEGFSYPDRCGVTTQECSNLPSSCSGCHVTDRGALTPAKTACYENDVCFFCPDDPSCDTTPTPTPTCANDNDGDGYLGEPGNTSCQDCDDSDTGVNPGATEDCVDGIDNDCNGAVDCDDSYCAGDPACWLENCVDYNNLKDRVGCKNDPNCNWSGKNGCSEIDPAQLACQEDGGRWNKKKKTCTIR